MTAAAYARYSTYRQNENSIAAQLDGIIKFCQANSHTITKTFVDEAQTGTNTNRQGFASLLAGARAGLFQAVVIYDISRGSRDVADWFNFRKEMQAHNIQVLSATEWLGDISNPNDFLVELINVGLGQHMVLQTRQKSMAGVAQKAKDGVFLGGVAPLGYDILNQQYTINSHEASAVRLIFERYAAGDSYDTIIDALAAKGYRGKRGQAIGKNSLNVILKNERYIGVYFWNKKQNKFMGKWSGGKDNPNVVRIVDAVPAIIDMNTWERVQKRMTSNKKRNAANTAKTEYLLSGLIECGQVRRNIHRQDKHQRQRL
jgi:site-specific DNA recombinase